MPAASALANILRTPSLGYYYAQKAVRSQGLRAAFGAAVARTRPRLQSEPDADASAAAATLAEDGICFLPQLQLAQENLDAIHAYLADKPVVDWYDGKEYPLDEAPRRYSKLGYKTSDLVGCQPLLQLANHPTVLGAVARVLGAWPTIGWFQSWWILGEHYQPGTEQYDDIYHRDVDDFRFVKLFAYLTDTGPRNGAHSFVRRSHRSAALTRRGPISDEDVARHFPAQDILTITGTAGTVFLEDTWGIHRPLLATEGRRLIFSALYALTPWVPRGAHDTPVHPMPPGIDPYVNRALFTRNAGQPLR